MRPLECLPTATVTTFPPFVCKSGLDGAKSAPQRIGPLINAGEGSEQCLNIVLVRSTEGGIKGEGEKKFRTCGNFQSYIFNAFSAVS